jgi:hypothetical protein
MNVSKIVWLKSERMWVVTLPSGNVYTYPNYLVRSLVGASRKALSDELKVS